MEFKTANIKKMPMAFLMPVILSEARKTEPINAVVIIWNVEKYGLKIYSG